MRRTPAAVAALVATVGVLLSGCGGGTKAPLGTSGAHIAHAADVVVPSSVLSLNVSPEDVTKTVQNAQRAYVDSLVMYGLRTDKLLQATFQVSRFVPSAKYRTDKFRLAVVDQIGSQSPVTLDVAGQTVYLTAGNRQNLYVWFKGAYFFVLAVRQDFASPRALLRQLLAVPA